MYFEWDLEPERMLSETRNVEVHLKVSIRSGLAKDHPPFTVFARGILLDLSGFFRVWLAHRHVRVLGRVRRLLDRKRFGTCGGAQSIV
jgi:hypothetical protein